MNRYIIKTVFLISVLACTIGAGAQSMLQTFYAKNSGDWKVSTNWTIDASGSVYTNPNNIIPGISEISAGKRECNIVIGAGKSMTINLPDEGEGDYLIINELTVNGEIFINSSYNSKQKVVIRKLLGNGVFKTNHLNMLKLEKADNDNGEMFKPNTFSGVVKLANNTGENVIMGNPLALIDANYSEMPMPASTIEGGTLSLVTDYYIDGDLTIEDGCTIYIREGVTITVTGDVINHGTIQSVAASEGGKDATLRIYGNLDNTDGTLKLFGYAGGQKLLNNTITEFVGNSDSDFELNAGGADKNLVFRIVVEKDDNAALHTYASKAGNYMTLAAIPTLNSGATYKEMPIVAYKGVLDLGQGVEMGGDADGWWNAIAGGKFDPAVLKFDEVEDSKGAFYIREGATLSISGANIKVGLYNPVFIAGEMKMNSGSFTSGGPGIFYVYPIVENDSRGGIEKSSQMPTRMTINGGELHASRIVSLNTSGAFRPAVHYQNGGTLAFDTENVTYWSTMEAGDYDQLGYTNKTVCLGKNSQFVMHGGNLIVKNNAVGKNKTYGDLQILMADISDPMNPIALPTLIDGGTITITGQGISAIIGTCNNVTVADGASLYLGTVADGIRVNGNMVINGTMVPNNDFMLAGNFTVTGTYSTADHDLIFVGKKDSKYDANGVAWRNIRLEKEDNAFVNIADNTTLQLNGDMTANSGKMKGSVTMVGTSDQTIYDYTDGYAGFANVDLKINRGNASGRPQLGTNVTLNNVDFKVNSKFYLDYYNLKIKNYPTATNSWSASCGFEVPSENTAAAHGLTLPVLASTGEKYKFPMIVGGYYTYVRVLYNTTQIGGAADVTVVPVNGKHPALAQDAALKCYWIINSTSNYSTPANFNLYECLNFVKSDNMNVLTTRRQIFFTSEGSKRGKELTNLSRTGSEITAGPGYKITYNTENGGSTRLSGEFTGGKSSDADDNYIYYSQDTQSKLWNESIWKRKKTGGALESTYYSGSSINTCDEVVIDHDIVFNASTTHNAGVITINSGHSLTVEEANANYLKAVSIKGDGSLIYKTGTGNEGKVEILSAQHSELCNSTTAKMVIELQGNRKLDIKAIRDYPNLEVRGNGKLTLDNGTDFNVRGNLTINGKGVTFDCPTGINVIIQNNLEILNGATLVLGQAQKDKELKVEGNIINNGTISGGGCDVYLWNSVTNNGVINIAGDVYFWGVSGNEQAVYVDGTAGATDTKLGDVIHISKSAASCIVDFRTPVTTGTGETVVNIETGVLNMSHSGETTLKQYPKTTVTDFSIPVDGSLYVTGGTANIAINGDSNREHSIYLAGRLNITGGARVNVHATDDTSARRGIVYSSNGVLTIEGPDEGSSETSLYTSYITPSSEGSALELTTRNKVSINCVDGQPMDGLGAFDVRNGNVNLSAATTVNISSNARTPNSTPSLYFEPKYAVIDPATTFNIDCTSTFGIESHTVLGTLNINENAKLLNNGIELKGDLNIAENKTFDATGHEISIAGDFTANGTFVPGNGQTTIMNGTSAQTLTMSGTSELYDFEFNGTSLTTTGDVVISNGLLLSKGSITANNGFRAKKSADLEPNTTIGGKGLIVGGGSEAEYVADLHCEGKVNILDIDNKGGVNCSLKQNKAITISEKLKMTNGVFEIGSNRIELLGNATIEGDNYGLDKMIATNGSFTDNGIKIYWNSVGDTKNYTMPLGKKGKVYSPVIFYEVKASVAGDLCFTVNDGYQSEVEEAMKDSRNSGKLAIPYFWSVQCNNLQTSEGYIEVTYPKTEDNSFYSQLKAMYYNFRTSKWESEETAINTEGQNIILRYNTKGRNTFTSDYTAFDESMVIENVSAYCAMANNVLGDGEVNYWDKAIWRKGGISINGNIVTFVADENDTNLYNIPYLAGAFIGEGVHVKVRAKDDSNSTVLVNAKRVTILKNATLEFEADAVNNNLTEVYGAGTLKVNSEQSMPSARVSTFCAAYGGTFEYSGEGDYSVLSFPEVNNVVFSGTGKRILRSDIDVNILGGITINGPEVVFSNGHALTIESKYGQTAMTLTSGSVTGNGYFSINGANQQRISIGNLNTIPGLIVNNAAGVTVDNNLTVSNLKLISGTLKLADYTLTIKASGSISGGSSASYIDGRLRVSPRPGVESVYPIGDNSYYARTAMTTMENGEWELHYEHKNPIEIVKESEQSMLNELWHVTAPSNAAQATLVLRWDKNSGGQFVSSNTLVTLTNTANDWDILDFTDYTGTNENGTIKTVQHTVNDAQGNGRYYAFSSSSNSSEYIWTGRAGTTWTDTQNWLYHNVPEQRNDVIIRSASSGNYPNLSTTTVYVKSITVEKGASITLGNGSKTELSEGLDVESGANVLIKGGTTTINGDIVNGGTITLEGHGTTLYATDIENNGTFNVNYKYNANPNLYYTGALRGSNKFAVNRTFLSRRVFYTGSATEERTISGLTNDHIYYFAAGQYNTEHVTTFSDPYTIKGTVSDGNIATSMLAIGTTDGKEKTLVQNGTLSNAKQYTVDAPSYLAENGDAIGWMWVSQPYPFSLNISGVELDDNTNKTVYTYSKESGVYKYVTYNIEAKETVNGDITTLAPFQAICIKNTAAKDLSRISFSPIKPTTATSLKSLKTATKADVLKIRATNSDNFSDEVALVFRDGESFYTTHDSNKRSNHNNAPSISVVKDEQKCAIAILPNTDELEEKVMYPLSISGNKNGLNIVVTTIDDFDSSMDVFIIDTKTQKEQNMRETSTYIVEDVDNLSEGQLCVMLQSAEPNRTPTETKDLLDNQISIRAIDNQAIVEVKSVEKNAVVTVYDIMGQVVKKENIKGETTIFTIGYDGLYILEVINGNDIATQKIILKK